jgi:TPR repeat protein
MTPSSATRYDKRPTSLPRKPALPAFNHQHQQSYPLNDIDELSAQQNPYPSPDHAQGMAEQYQQQLPHFNGRVTSVTSMQSGDSRYLRTPSPDLLLGRPEEPQIHEPLASPSYMPQHITQNPPTPQPQMAVISSGDSNRSSKSSSNFDADESRQTDSPISAVSSGDEVGQRPAKLYPQLMYHHQLAEGASGAPGAINGTLQRRNSSSPSSDSQNPGSSGQHLRPNPVYRGRPSSAYSLAPPDARSHSPSSPRQRAVSGQSYDSRRSSYVDLTLPAHIQQLPRPISTFDNTHLKSQVGQFASLLSSKQTLEMYRANAKKTQDPNLQFELAVFMIHLAQQMSNEVPSPDPSHRRASGSSNPESAPQVDFGSERKGLLREARQILESIANRLPKAQYYLGDAYASGLFNKGKPEDEKAFSLFVAASKHGHAEAGYRAGLCYEFGWGCRRDVVKAVQFYRHSCSKGHPGAMTRLGVACIRSDLGLNGRYREGLKWLKRATEIADEQYPSAPYELGLLHETGFGEDVFEDHSYAAQLFTQAATLGHMEAAYRMGDSYEHGKLKCPQDPALSVHFYTNAAQKGHPSAMMALCAWYLIGAVPALEKDEDEAYAWAFKAAETGAFIRMAMKWHTLTKWTGLPKANYAVGYFTEMGIGCRRDPLEANARYVRAAEKGDERAIARLKIINDSVGDADGRNSNSSNERLPQKKAGKKTLEKKQPQEAGDKGECTIM